MNLIFCGRRWRGEKPKIINKGSSGNDKSFERESEECDRLALGKERGKTALARIKFVLAGVAGRGG